jgi:thiol-disulfide isomerase/thioredoxin
MKYSILLFLFLEFAVYSVAQTSIDTAVAFTVKDTEGNTYQLYDILDQGNTVVIDFFTVTCGPCATYASEISQSYSHFGCNSGNVVYLGINWGDDNTQVHEFGQTYGAFYPEVSGLEGNGNHVVADYGVLSYPTVIIIRPDHSIAEKFIWPPSALHLDSLVNEQGGIPMDCNTAVSEKQPFSLPGIIQSISPNPALSHAVLKLDAIPGNYSFCLFASSGKLVKRIPAIQVSAREESFDLELSFIPPGYYILQVLAGNSVVDRRPFIVF